MVDRYSRALVLIPVVLALGAAASAHPQVALHQGLAGGSLLSTLLLYDALFRNPPVEPTARDAAVTALVGIGWLLTLVVL
ncbi:hypothetical protein [Natronomonas amylolytica]|uniref:hypothetical protein n=1 Tax=Natronomonas amylolytica TaxID=3108498 RepID=UPI00300963ED